MYKYILLAMLTILPISAAEIKEDISVPYIPYEIKMGEHFDLVQGQCLSCHSFGYMINQGPQSKKFWKGKIVKMITHFKAPITDEDVGYITDYFFKHYGNGKEE